MANILDGLVHSGLCKQMHVIYRATSVECYNSVLVIASINTAGLYMHSVYITHLPLLALLPSHRVMRTMLTIKAAIVSPLPIIFSNTHVRMIYKFRSSCAP